TPRWSGQANHLVRAVLVQPGDRLVEFAYHPPGFRPALLAAATAWALFAGAALRERLLRGRAGAMGDERGRFASGDRRRPIAARGTRRRPLDRGRRARARSIVVDEPEHVRI